MSTIALVRGLIADFLETSPLNSLTGQGGEKAWDRFLLGLASGADPIFDFYKQDIGDFFWTPAEAFRTVFPDLDPKPGELTVVSWVLPQRRAVREDHRREKDRPSERWSRTRLHGEICNEGLRRHVVEGLAAAGIPAMAPQLSPAWERHISAKYLFASRWSERHAAYAAGLGTFGLSDGLITPAGKAVRCGSVIARMAAEPTPRPYTDHHAFCLHFAAGRCGKCAQRCPAGAISEAGHDKEKCKAYIRGTMAPYVRDHQLGVEVNSCGLCQTGVPCEAGIPVKEWRERMRAGG
jgi:ferredoxin